jgi:hypothetical protein
MLLIAVGVGIGIGVVVVVVVVDGLIICCVELWFIELFLLLLLMMLELFFSWCGY